MGENESGSVMGTNAVCVICGWRGAYVFRPDQCSLYKTKFCKVFEMSKKKVEVSS